MILCIALMLSLPAVEEGGCLAEHDSGALNEDNGEGESQKEKKKCMYYRGEGGGDMHIYNPFYSIAAKKSLPIKNKRIQKNVTGTM